MGGARVVTPTFSGSTEEYFRIWIVNLLFTLVTLGVFSAWAKVRKKKYFYGNTRFDGDSFDYTAAPLAILKGRLLAAAVVVVYVLAGEIVAGAQIAFWVAAIIALPWLATRALLFNARNSAWRGIRFDFTGRGGAAAWTFLPRLPLVALSAGLAMPWFQARLRTWLVAHHAHGTAAWTCEIPVRGYYGAYLRAAGIMLLGATVIGAAGFVASTHSEQLPENLRFVAIAVPLVMGYLVYALAWAVVQARTTNLAWSGTRVGGIGFVSSLGSMALARLYLVNILAIIVSAGLLVPWATVRVYRYRLSCFSAVVEGAITHEAAPGQPPIGAAGQELGDLFNVDFGL